MLRWLFKRKKEEHRKPLSERQKKEESIKKRIEKFRCFNCNYDVYTNQPIIGKIHDNVIYFPIKCDKCNRDYTIEEPFRI